MSAQQRHRLGLAVEVGEPARAALAKVVAPLRQAYPGVRWVDPERWYIDLCHFGAVVDREAQHVDEVAHTIAERSPQVSLRLDGGAGVHNGSAVFAGVEPSPSFAALRHGVLDALRELAVPVSPADEVPTCVIGRVPGGVGLPPMIVHSFRGPAVTWVARRLVVVRTRLRLSGIGVEARSAHQLGQPLVAHS